MALVGKNLAKIVQLEAKDVYKVAQYGQRWPQDLSEIIGKPQKNIVFCIFCANFAKSKLCAICILSSIIIVPEVRSIKGPARYGLLGAFHGIGMHGGTAKRGPELCTEASKLQILFSLLS